MPGAAYLRQLQHFIYTKRLGGPILQTFSSKLYFQLSILRHKRGEGVVKQCSGFAQLLILWILHSLLSAAAGPFLQFPKKTFFRRISPRKFLQPGLPAWFPPLVGGKWGTGLDRLLFARTVLELRLLVICWQELASELQENMPLCSSYATVQLLVSLLENMPQSAAARVPPNYSARTTSYSAA